MFSSNPEQLRSLAAWLLEQEAEQVVMESTAQYLKPVWETLERYWKPLREKREGARRRSGTLHLAQAQSNRGRRGRKRDFPDAERLVKRLVARELIPNVEQRLWRTVTHKKYQLRCDRVRLQNQVESLLEEAHIKLSSFVSDLLGLIAQRMLKALADGETNPAALAALADVRLRATPEQLCDALGACTELNPVYRRLLKMANPQERHFSEGKVAAVGPTSAMICCAESTPRPGISARRSTASWCGLSRLAISLSSSPIYSSIMPGRRRERGRKLQPPVSEG
jgi:hypothetical protein